MVSTKSKLQKFIADKEKSLSQTDGVDSGKRTYERKEFLPFFSPNKMFGNRDEVVVRVLPNKEGFYHEYKKHMMKIGTFKQSICLHSLDENGKEISNNCPFCEFLNEYKNELSKEAGWAFMPKTSYLMLVFNPYAKQVQKWETNDYGIVDITKLLVERLDENSDFNPDEQGFDLVFRKEGQYAKPVELLIPEADVEEVLDMSTNVKEIRDFYGEIMPFSLSYTVKQSNALFEQAVNAFAPSLSGKFHTTEVEPETKVKRVSIADNVNDSYKESGIEEFDEVGEDENDSPKTKSTTKTTRTVVDTSEEDETEEDTSEQVKDIASFLKNRKKL